MRVQLEKVDMLVCSRVEYDLWTFSFEDLANSVTARHIKEHGFHADCRKTFTELKNAQSIVIPYDGLNPLPPTFCYLKPYYNDPNLSYFEQLARGQL